MSGVLPWVVFSIFISIFSIAGSTYTVSSENKVITEPTRTLSTYWFSDEEVASGKSKYEYTVVRNKGGKVIFDTADNAVSNCDILVRGNNNWRDISNRIIRLSRHLTSVEERVFFRCWDTYRKSEGLCIPGLKGQLGLELKREPTTAARLYTTPLAPSPRS